MLYISERCGAWQVGDSPTDGAISFRVFFPAGTDPHVAAIHAVGDFQTQLVGPAWDAAHAIALKRDDSDQRGTFWTAATATLPTGFYQYQYLVTFDTGETRLVTDPCARYGGLSNRNSAVVIGGSQPADNTVRPLPEGRRPLSELTIYELMIDDFTAGYRGALAPIEAVTAKLDDLRGIGINAILFMPWTTWKNTDFDWGYEPFQYFAVEARYANKPGAPAEKLSLLKQLVNACHDRGIHVIMDGVYNHVSFAFPYDQLYLDPATCPFTTAPFGGWFPGLQDLDFANACTQELIGDVCRYWIDVFGIDGIRLDNTVNYYVADDPRGLPSLLADIDNHVRDTGGENFSLTLEHLDLSAATVTNTTAATSFWDNSLFNLTFDYLWNDRIDSRLLNALNNRRFLQAGKIPTLYLSNHDHSHIGWQVGARGNTGATANWWKLQPFIIALFTSTAVPLIPNGQEFTEEHFIPEDDHGTGRRVTNRPLRWKIADDPVGRTTTALHRRLAQLRAAHSGLRSEHMDPAAWEEWQTQVNPAGIGIDVARKIAIYRRWASLDDDTIDDFVIVLNFSDAQQAINVPFPTPGLWDDVLAGFDGRSGPWSITVSGMTQDVVVGSHWGRVLHHVGPA